MRFLFVSPVFPWPQDTGTRVRLSNLMAALRRRGHDVGLVSNMDDAGEAYLEHARQELSDLRVVRNRQPGEHFSPDRLSPRRLKRLALGLACGEPLFACLAYRPEFEDAIRELSPHYDHVFVEFFFMSWNVPGDLLAASHWRFSLVEHDISHIPKRRAWEVAPWTQKPARWLEYRSWRRAELRALERFQTIIAMSGHDRDVLGTLAPGKRILVAPNGVDLSRFPAVERKDPAAPLNLLFVGGLGHQPNLDAVMHFAQDHMPVLRERFPGITFTVAGHADAWPGDAKAWPDIRFAGFVEDIRPLYDSCTAVAVPLRIAGGTRLKIIEAMAACAPVITTAVGAEGLGLEHGKTALFAETPQQMVQALTALVEEPGLSRRLAGQARDLCRQRFDWEHIAAELESDISAIKEHRHAL